MKKVIFSLVLVLVVAGCAGKLPEKIYTSRGKPENLLDNSAERVSFSLASSSDVSEVVSWINRDQPSRAELTCSKGGYACDPAKDALEQFKVPYKIVSYTESSSSSVALIYDRVVARDCDNRYVDNHFNPNNLNHRTFGCSVAANIVQSVTDQSEFINPGTMDPQDAERAGRVFDDYLDGKKHGSCEGNKCSMR